MEVIGGGGSLMYKEETKREQKRRREIHSKHGKHCGSWPWTCSCQSQESLATMEKKPSPKISLISSSQQSHIMQKKKVTVRTKLCENSWITRFFWRGEIKGVVFPSSVVGRYGYSNNTPQAVLEARSPKSRCQQGLSLLKSVVGLCHTSPLILIACWQSFFFF